MRTLSLPKEVEHWSLTTPRGKFVKVGAKAVRHGRYVVFQMAEVAVPRMLFAETLRLIAEFRPPSDSALAWGIRLSCIVARPRHQNRVAADLFTPRFLLALDRHPRRRAMRSQLLAVCPPCAWPSAPGRWTRIALQATSNLWPRRLPCNPTSAASCLCAGVAPSAAPVRLPSGWHSSVFLNMIDCYKSLTGCARVRTCRIRAAVPRADLARIAAGGHAQTHD